MKTIAVIGMGAGNPEHLTLQAVAAMARTDVFFVIDKGTAPELLALRDDLIARHARPGHRIVTVVDAERDRDPQDYRAEVQRWHRARVERIGAALEAELPDGGTGAVLVWGDPSLYDSTLRIVDQLVAAAPAGLTVEVVPGITSVQALAAAHRVPLHGIGEPVHITTGRRLAEDWAGSPPSAVVMLDGQLAFEGVPADGVEILWGAYLGTPHEVLVAGDLAEVAAHIVAERAAARERHGWIMDTYLLRRRAPGG